MQRNESINYTKRKYTAEKPAKLEVVQVSEDLYTTSHRRGIAFLNRSEKNVVVPTCFVESLKLKRQMQEKT